jgi:hypothetical protein
MTELTTPTAIEIAKVIDDMQHDRSDFLAWFRSGKDPDMEKLPCWVDMFELDDGDWVFNDICAGGKTYAEAAAVAWVFSQAKHLPHGHYEFGFADVPLQVPEGFRFEPYLDEVTTR